MTKGRAIEYSDAELFWIHDHHKRPRKEAHAEFQELWNRPDVSLIHFNALCKRKGWMTGRTGCFEKGQAPANKGKKMPFNPNSARTQFKRGNRPHTYRGPGHERICAKDGYVIMTIAERNPWTGADTRPVLKHRHLWEKANGPVPEGHWLKCLDGDRTNCDRTNWEAVPMALAPRLNGRFGRGYDAAPVELKPTILATAKLEHAAREAKKRS